MRKTAKSENLKFFPKSEQYWWILIPLWNLGCSMPIFVFISNFAELHLQSFIFHVLLIDLLLYLIDLHIMVIDLRREKCLSGCFTIQ